MIQYSRPNPEFDQRSTRCERVDRRLWFSYILMVRMFHRFCVCSTTHLQIIGLPEVFPCRVNNKQCSRQLQCEVPCGIGNGVNSSSFINSSLSSLSSTSHVVHTVCGGPASAGGGVSRGRGVWQGEGEPGRGRGQGSFQSSCHIRGSSQIFCI